MLRFFSAAFSMASGSDWEVLLLVYLYIPSKMESEELLVGIRSADTCAHKKGPVLTPKGDL